jgi:hypothetical protein
MARFNNPLDNIRVAAPCPADWDRMIGSDRVRYCGQCKLNVYNLSEMSRREAEALIEQTEGRLCVRFYRRADGTVLNRNCPVGLRAIKRRLSRVGTALVSTLLGFFAGLGFDAGLNWQGPTANYGIEHATTGTMVSREPERVPVNRADALPDVQDQVEVGMMSYRDSCKVPVWKQRPRGSGGNYRH